MDFKRLGQRAKDLVDKRGGTDALKEDAAELKNIARGSGTASEKAKRAAAALKDPDREGAETAAAADAPATPEQAPPEGREPARRDRDDV